MVSSIQSNSHYRRTAGFSFASFLPLSTSMGIVAAVVCLVLLGSTAAMASDHIASETTGTTRVYYIAAEEIVWDYLPTGRDCMHATPLNTNDGIMATLSCPTKSNHTGGGHSGGGAHGMSVDDNSRHPVPKFAAHAHGNGLGGENEVLAEHSPEKWVKQGRERIGRRYMKAHYQEYTDATFSVHKNRTEREMHLGLLGPIIRAVVGDTIQIVFHNRATRPYSIHPHGVFYTKANEGSPYADDAAASIGDGVPAGGNFTYTFLVPERAGPGDSDPSSVMWLYHSHVDEVADTNAGLFGVMIITRAGMANEDATPIDVDREFVTSLTVYDEGESAYFMDNIKMFLNNSYNPDFSDSWVKTLLESTDFLDSNEMHAINGYLYANLPGLYMEEADRVRWYTFALGSEEGFHTAHWHGQTLVSYGQRVDTIAVFPSTTHIADMVPDNEGLWMYHCHVNHHIHGGMTSLFEVDESTKPVPHTVHNEPVAPWVWFVIFLILLVPMAIFGGMFAKTYMKPGAATNYSAALQSSPAAPRRSIRSASASQRSRNGHTNGSNGINGGHSSAAAAAAVSGSTGAAISDERKVPVVVSRTKITGYGSPTSPSDALTEKRGVGIAIISPHEANHPTSASSSSSSGSIGVISPLKSPPYQTLSNDGSLETDSNGHSVLTVHTEPLPIAMAAPTTHANQIIVALDVFQS